jgi:hypothetical protein
MSDNAFRSVMVRSGPWLPQCSGQHPTRRGTPRRWHNLDFSCFACCAHDVRLRRTERWCPDGRACAVRYEVAGPVTACYPHTVYSATAYSSRRREHRLLRYCVGGAAVNWHQGSALRIGSYLHERCGRPAAKYGVTYRDRYLIGYLTDNCAHCHPPCHGRRGGGSTEHDGAGWSGYGVAQYSGPNARPDEPPNRRLCSVLTAAGNRSHRGDRSGDDDSLTHCADRGEPNYASSHAKYRPACTRGHPDAKADQSMRQCNHARTTANCNDRLRPSPAPHYERSRGANGTHNLGQRVTEGSWAGREANPHLHCRRHPHPNVEQDKPPDNPGCVRVITRIGPHTK